MSSNLTPKPHQWLAWIGTATLMLAAMLAAFNVYPYYIFGFVISNTIWLVVGILWQERSLIAMNFFLNVIYIVGWLF